MFYWGSIILTDLVVNMFFADPVEVAEAVFRVASLHSITHHIFCIIVKSVPEPRLCIKRYIHVVDPTSYCI